MQQKMLLFKQWANDAYPSSCSNYSHPLNILQSSIFINSIQPRLNALYFRIYLYKQAPSRGMYKLMKIFSHSCLYNMLKFHSLEKQLLKSVSISIVYLASIARSSEWDAGDGKISVFPSKDMYKKINVKSKTQHFFVTPARWEE